MKIRRQHPNGRIEIIDPSKHEVLNFNPPFTAGPSQNFAFVTHAHLVNLGMETKWIGYNIYFIPIDLAGLDYKLLDYMELSQIVAGDYPDRVTANNLAHALRKQARIDVLLLTRIYYISDPKLEHILRQSGEGNPIISLIDFGTGVSPYVLSADMGVTHVVDNSTYVNSVDNKDDI